MTQRRRQSYQPVRTRSVPVIRFTVTWAYAKLRSQGVKAFPKHLQNEEVLAWAFDKARELDRGHEAEYPEGNDPFLADGLYDLIHENVRMWAEVRTRELGAAA